VEEEERSSSTRSSSKQIRNYELDKTISHIREVPGTLRKLSVAVVVDYQDMVNDKGEIERSALGEERLAELTGLVKDTIGFDEERGDSVNVINASFVPAPALEPLPEPSILEQEWVWRIAKYVLSGIALVLVVMTVLRPLMQASAVPPAAPAALGGPQGGTAMSNLGGANEVGLPEDQVTLGGQPQLGPPGGMSSYQQQLQMARSMVEGEPQRVAHVVKNWVSADG